MVKNSSALGAWFQSRLRVALTRGSDQEYERRVIERVGGSGWVRIRLAIVVVGGGSGGGKEAEAVFEAAEKGLSRKKALSFLVVVRRSI